MGGKYLLFYGTSNLPVAYVHSDRVKKKGGEEVSLRAIPRRLQQRWVMKHEEIFAQVSSLGKGKAYAEGISYIISNSYAMKKILLQSPF